MAGSGIFN